MMTTTGYASADFMFVGGSTGSAAGAIKVVRLLVLTRVLRRELDQTVRHEAIVPLRLNGAVLDERTISRDQGVRDVYLAMFLLGTLARRVGGTPDRATRADVVGGHSLQRRPRSGTPARASARSAR